MTQHEFDGIVYDMNSTILFANMYLYGFNREKLPLNYTPTFQNNRSGIPHLGIMKMDSTVGGNQMPWTETNFPNKNHKTLENTNSKCDCCICNLKTVITSFVVIEIWWLHNNQ